MPDVQLRELEYEEEKDFQSIKIFIEKHKKTFRYLFNKYANSGYSPRKIAQLDILKEKNESINMAELLRMLKDHNVTLRMISHSELAALLRLLNQKIIQRCDLTPLSYECFIEFFLQLAFFIFGRAPYYMNYASPINLVELLMNHFKQASSIQGESSNFYSISHSAASGDQNLVKDLNLHLESNPNYPLPPGYKKTEEDTTVEKYQIQNVFPIKESVKFATEIIDNILMHNFGVHVIEPITSIEKKMKVFPVAPKRIIRDLSIRKKSLKPLNLEQRKSTLQKSYIPTTTKQKNSLEHTKPLVSLNELHRETIKPPLTPQMKKQIARSPLNMRPIVKEVADVVSDIVQAVSEKRQEIGSKYTNIPEKKLNETPKLNKGRKMRAKVIKNIVSEMKLEKKMKMDAEKQMLYIYNIKKFTFRQKKKEEEIHKQKKEKELAEQKRLMALEEKRRLEEEAKSNLEEEYKSLAKQKRENQRELLLIKRKNNEKNVIFLNKLMYRKIKIVQ